MSPSGCSGRSCTAPDDRFQVDTEVVPFLCGGGRRVVDRRGRMRLDLRAFRQGRRAEGRKMKVALPGGSGQVGLVLARAFVADGHEVVVLSRKPGPAPWRVVEWDAETPGRWAADLDGADVVINLAGRSVNCRYT